MTSSLTPTPNDKSSDNQLNQSEQTETTSVQMQSPLHQVPTALSRNLSVDEAVKQLAKIAGPDKKRQYIMRLQKSYGNDFTGRVLKTVQQKRSAKLPPPGQAPIPAQLKEAVASNSVARSIIQRTPVEGAIVQQSQALDQSNTELGAAVSEQNSKADTLLTDASKIETLVPQGKEQLTSVNASTDQLTNKQATVATQAQAKKTSSQESQGKINPLLGPGQAAVDTAQGASNTVAGFKGAAFGWFDSQIQQAADGLGSIAQKMRQGVQGLQAGSDQAVAASIDADNTQAALTATKEPAATTKTTLQTGLADLAEVTQLNAAAKQEVITAKGQLLSLNSIKAQAKGFQRQVTSGASLIGQLVESGRRKVAGTGADATSGTTINRVPDTTKQGPSLFTLNFNLGGKTFSEPHLGAATVPAVQAQVNTVNASQQSGWSLIKQGWTKFIEQEQKLANSPITIAALAAVTLIPKLAEFGGKYVPLLGGLLGGFDLIANGGKIVDAFKGHDNKKKVQASDEVTGDLAAICYGIAALLGLVEAGLELPTVGAATVLTPFVAFFGGAGTVFLAINLVLKAIEVVWDVQAIMSAKNSDDATTAWLNLGMDVLGAGLDIAGLKGAFGGKGKAVEPSKNATPSGVGDQPPSTEVTPIEEPKISTPPAGSDKTPSVESDKTLPAGSDKTLPVESDKTPSTEEKPAWPDDPDIKAKIEGLDKDRLIAIREKLSPEAQQAFDDWLKNSTPREIENNLKKPDQGMVDKFEQPYIDQKTVNGAYDKLAESGFLKDPKIQNAITRGDDTAIRGAVGEDLAATEVAKSIEGTNQTMQRDVTLGRRVAEGTTLDEWLKTPEGIEWGKTNNTDALYQITSASGPEVYVSLGEADILVVNNDTKVPTYAEEVKAASSATAKSAMSQLKGKFVENLSNLIDNPTGEYALHRGRLADITSEVKIEAETIPNIKLATRGPAGRTGFTESLGLNQRQIDMLVQKILGL
jgi:hypothetical protein